VTAIPQTETVRMLLTDLLPAGYNPRKMTPAAMAGLKASLSKFGELGGIVFNRRLNRLAGGHQRVKALVALGETHAEVRVVDLDETDEKALNLTLNNAAIGGDWAEAQLAELLGDAQAALGDLFSDLKLDALWAFAEQQPPGGGGGDPDDAPAPPQQPVTRAGDLWLMGEHRLICGSCTDADAVHRATGGRKADACLTDPPYGLGNSATDKNNYATYDDSVENLKTLVDGFLPIAQGIAPVVVLTSGIMNQFIYPRPTWTMAWFTPAGIGCGPWGFCCWQPMLCYGKDPKLAKGKGSHPDAIVHTEVSPDIDHPCPKPVGLWKWLIERTTERGATLYEPFSGSGTTIIAGEMTHRHVYAVELAPEYVDVAVRRWQAFTGKAATLDGDGRTFEAVAAERLAEAA